jgi:sugar phosphate permease
MNQVSNQNRTFNSDRITTIILVTLCLTFQALPLSGVALFLPEIRKDLGLSFTEGGALSAASMLTYAFMQIPSGYLADRFGSRRIFFIGALGVTILSLTFGLISSYWQGITSQALSGLFRAFLFVPSIAILTSWFRPERRATATGLSAVGLLLGQILVNSISPALEAQFDWRFPFLAFSAAGVIICLAYIKFTKDSPNTSTQYRASLIEISRVFQYRIIWLCSGIQYVRFAIFQGINMWLPSLLIDEQGISLQVAGVIMAIRALLTAPAQLLGGYVSDKLRSPAIVIGISLIVLLFTTAMLVRVNNMALLITVIMVNAIFVQFYFGPLFAMPVELIGKHMAGTITGVGNFFANLGGFTFVYLLGALKDVSGSFETGFYAMSGMCIIGLLFTLFLAQEIRKSIKPPASL